MYYLECVFHVTPEQKEKTALQSRLFRLRVRGESEAEL